MSRTQVGGLVVLQGSEDVRPWLGESEECDARLFPGLIEALFAWRATSLGGLVIVGDRLRFREVFLAVPDANDPSDKPEWGSRHRCALLLSRRCDALVLVVSEERGTITTFHRGASSAASFPTTDTDEAWAAMANRVCDVLRAWATSATVDSVAPCTTT
jgi:diadenylate cyclase